MREIISRDCAEYSGEPSINKRFKEDNFGENGEVRQLRTNEYSVQIKNDDE